MTNYRRAHTRKIKLGVTVTESVDPIDLRCTPEVSQRHLPRIQHPNTAMLLPSVPASCCCLSSPGGCCAVLQFPSVLWSRLRHTRLTSGTLGPLCGASCIADDVVQAVLLGTITNGNVEPQYWREGPRTAMPTDTIEEWDIINFTADGERLNK